MNDHYYLTPNQMATEMQCSIRVMNRAILRDMTHVKFGKQIRVRYNEFERWKATQCRNTKVTPELIAAMVKNMRAQRAKEILNAVSANSNR